MLSSPSSKALASLSFVQDLDAGGNLDQYKKLHVIGTGATGKVYKGLSQRTGRTYALKTVSVEALDDSDKEEMVCRVKVWEHLHHPALVHHIDHFVGRGKLWLVLELCRSDLLSFMRCRRVARRPVNEKLVWRILHSICEALLYLHSQGIAHGAVKVSNILMAGEGRFKLGNFGFRRRKRRLQSQENTQSSMRECQGDMWGLGYILYFVCKMELPFDSNVPMEGTTRDEMAAAAFLPRPAPLPSFYSKLLKALIFRLLSDFPHQRPSAEEVLAMVPESLTREFHSQHRGRRHCCYHHSQSNRTSKLTVVHRKTDFVAGGSLASPSWEDSQSHVKFSRIANTHSMLSAREMTLGRRQGPVADPGGPGRLPVESELKQLNLPLPIPLEDPSGDADLGTEANSEELLSPISVNNNLHKLPDVHSQKQKSKTWSHQTLEPLPAQYRLYSKTYTQARKSQLDLNNNSRYSSTDSLRRSASEDFNNPYSDRDAENHLGSKKLPQTEQSGPKSVPEVEVHPESDESYEDDTTGVFASQTPSSRFSGSRGSLLRKDDSDYFFQRQHSRSLETGGKFSHLLPSRHSLKTL